MSGKQTTLDLNGPILSFIQQPDAVSTTLSTATFVGIATATFPTQSPVNLASSTGIISYQWYAEGVGALSNGSFRGATVSGTATTTLTLSNLKSPETNNVNFFLIADYTPSAYGLIGVAVTVGSARSTGNAVNDPLSSNTAKLNVLPTIAITSQPVSVTIGAGSRVSFSVSATITDSSYGGLSYQWNVDGQNLTDNGNTIIGATQPTLFFVPTSVGVSTVKVTISNPSAVSVTSSIVNLIILSPRNIIVFEGFDSQNNYLKNEVYLNIVDNFILTDDTFGSNFNIISFHAPENSIDADMEIRASKGLDTGSYSGGQGGFSRIRITLEKDIEYTVLGISNNSGLFIYRKSSLIAVVGKGGSAGSFGNGGAGGGINLPGENGFGRNTGIGGARLSAGQLTTNGIFGSNSTITSFQSGDSKASIPNGGRTISCSKGNYWLSRGKSPCEDVGLTQFYNTNGTLISRSSLINRGFKPGYSITATEGSSISTGGDGGNGATGGSGGNQGGGGGGSGYTDGSYTVTSALSGGNTSSKSTINFKVFVPIPPIRGCTDPSATNYNSNAVEDDGSCIYSPPSLPEIIGFTASPTSIITGNSSEVTLSWNIRNATGASINQGIGVVGYEGGSRRVNPTTTTTYTLTATATGRGGTTTATRTVTVDVYQPPTISSFTASPTAIIIGNSSTLAWSITNTTSVTIDNGVGTFGPSGSTSVTPNTTTTYILTATGPGGTITRSVTITVYQLPVVTAFTASPTTIIAGNSSTLSWSTTNVTSVFIDTSEGAGNFGPNGSTSVSPLTPGETETKAYTLTATGPGGTITKSVTVTVTRPSPTINSFTASPTTIISGNSSTLSWSTTNVTSVTIDNGVGTFGPSNSTSVSPNTTTTYTLTATGLGGTTTATVTVTVNPPTLVAPTISSFTASPTAIIIGNSSTLAWSITNTTSVTIDNGVGTFGPSGSTSVTPNTTTTYILTATGPGGTITRSVTITVYQLPVVTAFTASPTTIIAGNSSTLSWSTTNVTSVTITSSGGGNFGPNGSTSVSPLTPTITYTLTATGPGGTTTATVTVTVYRLPTISSFTASPNTIIAGNSSTLTWSTTNTTSVSINNGVGTFGPSGSTSVTPDDTTTYTLTATGPGGTITRSDTVTVNPPSPPPTAVTAESIYGTGFQGITRYNNGTQGDSSAFITNLKPQYNIIQNNAIGQLNIGTYNFIQSLYRQVLGRPPEGPGLDYWFAGAVNGDYTDVYDLERIFQIAAIPELGDTRIKGGIIGTFDTIGNRI